MTVSIDLKRYDRQILIDGFGEEGQERLKGSTVLIAGVGGLGSPAAFYLAAAGVGNIRIVDKDEVQISNLNRQILHWQSDIGRFKADSAKDKIERFNPDIKIDAIATTINQENVFDLANGCDAIVDALDNFPARYLLNKTALHLKIPFFHGSVYGFEGRAMTVIPGKSSCLRCLYKKGAPEFEFPVIGISPAVIGSIQAAEVIKHIVGLGKLLSDRLLIFDGLSLTFREMKLKRNPDCADCAKVPGNGE